MRVGASVVFQNGVLPKQLPKFNVDEMRDAALRGEKLLDIKEFLVYTRLPMERRYTEKKFVAAACSDILELSAPIVAKMSHQVGKAINEAFYGGERYAGHLIWSIFIIICEDNRLDRHRYLHAALEDLDFSQVKHKDAELLYRYMRVMHTSGILLGLLGEVLEALGHMVDTFMIRYEPELNVMSQTVKPEVLRDTAVKVGAYPEAVRNFDEQIDKTLNCYSQLYPYQAADALCDVYYNSHVAAEKVAMLVTARYGYNAEELAKSFQWLRSETVEAILTPQQQVNGLYDWLIGKPKKEKEEDSPQYKDDPSDTEEIFRLKNMIRARLKRQRELNEELSELRQPTGKGKAEETQEMKDLREKIDNLGAELSKMIDDLIAVKAKTRAADLELSKRRKEAERNPDNIFKYKMNPSATEAAKQRRLTELRDVEAKIFAVDAKIEAFKSQIQQEVQGTLRELNSAFMSEIAEADSSDRKTKKKTSHQARMAIVSESAASLMRETENAKVREALVERRQQLLYEISELTAQEVEMDTFINKDSKKYCCTAISTTVVSSVVWGVWAYVKGLAQDALQSRATFMAISAERGVASFAQYLLDRYTVPPSFMSLPAPLDLEKLRLLSQQVISDVNILKPGSAEFQNMMQNLLTMVHGLEAENVGSGGFFKLISAAREGLERYTLDNNSVDINQLRTLVNNMLRVCLSVGNKLDEGFATKLFEGFKAAASGMSQAATTTGAAVFSFYNYATTVNAPKIDNLSPWQLFKMAGEARSKEYVTAAGNLMKSILVTGLGYTSLVLLLFAQVSWSFSRARYLETNLASEVSLFLFNSRTTMIGVIDIMMDTILTSTESMSVLKFSLFAGFATIASLMMPGYGWIGAVLGFFNQRLESLRAPRLQPTQPVATVAPTPAQLPAPDPEMQNFIRRTAQTANTELRQRRRDVVQRSSDPRDDVTSSEDERGEE